MKIMKKILVTLGLFVGLMSVNAREFIRFTGGPVGGTFQYFTNGMSTYLSDNIEGDINFTNQSSNGSGENLRKIHSNRANIGIVYSGDLHLGRNGLLTNDTAEYTNAYAVAFLYKAPMQLAVLKNSGIDSVEDLAGKRIDIGGPGSGAAAAGERYLKAVGLWDRVTVSNLGYSKAAVAMQNNQVDAMWALVGYPTSAFIELSNSRDINLLDVHKSGIENGLADEYPFYQKLTIPSNTYKGVDYTVDSFHDSAILVANEEVSAELVYEMLTKLYSEEGLAYMVNVRSTARQMTIEDGLTGVVTAVHPGAVRFWREKGIDIPVE